MQVRKLLNFRRQLNKPEYYLRPQQIFRRLFYKKKGGAKVAVKIDNHSNPFFVNENEVIGASLLSMGVYDLVVGESVCRLIEDQDTFVDIGANIGYFSRLALQNGGSTYSFEPHPKIYECLTENLQGFSKSKTFNCALSDKKGNFSLYIPRDFEKNEGIASLNPLPGALEINVKTEKLDSLNLGSIKLLKIDVEGHETSVLKGASQLLENKKIENIVFEDFEGEASSTIHYLKGYGYSVFRLKKTLLGPQLIGVAEGLSLPKWEPPNYLACLDDKKTRLIFSSRGWQLLNQLKF